MEDMFNSSTTSNLPSEKEAKKEMNSNINKLDELKENEINKLKQEIKEREELKDKYKRSDGCLPLAVVVIISTIVFFSTFSSSGFFSSLGSAFIVAFALGIFYELVFLCIKQFNKTRLEMLPKEIELVHKNFVQKASLEKEHYAEKIIEIKKRNKKAILVNNYSSNEYITSTIYSLTKVFSDHIQSAPRKDCNESITSLFKIDVTSEKILYNYNSYKDYLLPPDRYNKTALDFNKVRLLPLSTSTERKKVTQAVVEGVKALIAINFPYDYCEGYGYLKYKPTISVVYSQDFCSATITYKCKNANYTPPPPLKPWF